MALIAIEKMEFYALHGCFQEEQQIGTWFEINLTVETDTSKAEISDCLEDTIDYQSIYQTVKRQMEIPSKLIEHVARRIIDAVWSEFPVTSVEITLRKLNPPLGGKMNAVAITIKQ
jgi:dihydroneopterin aldolase